MPYTNRQWLLAARPVGMVKETDFRLASEEIPGVADGEFLIRNLFLAFEPAQRGWIDDVESYIPPVQLGEAMRAGTVGQVIESKHPEFEKGQLVSGMFGWQEYYLTDGTPGPFGGVSRVPDGIPPQRMLSVLGATGMTAYFGIHDIHPVNEGDNVLVSGAAGATGSVASQIARIRGAGKVVGIAGGPDKCKWLVEEAKLDAAIDYKNEDVLRRMREEFPNGVDLYFDNVGGDILDAALLAMAERGRITMCGGISGYNEETPPPGPSNIMQIVIKRLSVKGFILFDHVANAGQAIADLAKWSASGEIAVEEDIQEGFENTPKTFLRLFQGKNLGKQLIKIADAE
ncbi:MAG: NADP-dependent oxidoreductase [bacterium]|nr:NADP-dependent oxidoreductase [bacterium]